MKFTTTILILFLLFSCNQKKDNTKLDLCPKTDELIKKTHDKDRNYALNKLKLGHPKDLKNKTLRIWCFYGGGAIFSELYELNIEKSELKLYSYLIEDVDKKESKELSKFEYVVKIDDKKIIADFINTTNKKSFLNIRSRNEYCESRRICGNSFEIEYINQETIKTFKVDDDIKNCNNENAQELKYFYSQLEKLISKKNT
ncbi:hypothetical protein [Flavobacterium aestuarii]|uniref:hypothetical protein n=1 Tax=Flavobacterium aestuarii TaxID=3149227 RepID=UPI0032B47AF3